MALYLVEHNPANASDAELRPSSSLVEMAREAVAKGVTPRWLRTWSPGLHDERVFSLWEADNAAQIEAALARFGFLDDMNARPLRVQEWGPEDVLRNNDAKSYDFGDG